MLGYPAKGIPKVHGRPARYWIQLHMLCHYRNGVDWVRLDWPDGQPLLAQSWPLVEIFQIVGDECSTIAEESMRSHKRT